ncbi:uncharacterized protein LOC111405123 isoform X2 [Olea europaea var. sylvestris]|uniref:uncharacterized protein LOC111405123 isoform X2 n=1 Tax=Olea europaea var. sylvestris TaxID=158386 RepID=UPI000C1D6536|nr:uncharacterized protein LOC111405123 isoform X2 [Olea europaea var. sylvestris]
MDCNITVEETILVMDEEEPPHDLTFEEEEWIPLKCHLNDSDDEVNDDGFQFDTNAPERVVVGFNADPTVEFEVAGIEELENDDGYYPSEEELHTDNSSSEEENYSFPFYDVEKEKYNPQLEVGKEFKNIEEFKEAVRNHGVATRHNFKFRPNDGERAQAICKKDNCKFRIWASLNKALGCVQIKSKNSEHRCMRDRTNRHCTARYIAERYLETFKVDPDWKTRLIKKVVKDDLKLTVSDVTTWRARRYARILIEGSDQHQFGLLRSFAVEILRTNPGSTCIIAMNAEKFHGIYVCLEACKRGFFEGCRQLLGLDGCFLKGTFEGQMLVAVVLDANDCIYPVAYAIVERENATTWRWFIGHLGEDLKIMNSNEWTFMTDRQKDLQNVIKGLYPKVEHRFCVRHMYTNFFRADFKSLTLKDYLWRAAKSTTISNWKFWMDEIEKVSKAAHGWLMKRHSSEWSKAHFLTKVKSDIVLNNLCEVFNNVVLGDREKSILTMLIDIYVRFMKMIQSRRDKMSKAVGPLCPKI